MDANESVRSSEAGSNVGDGCNPSASFVDERSRLERKIEKLREQLTRNSIAREGDVEEYLKNTQGIENMPENPQMVRIRQHFEKKNRKYTQETEQLQKRLEDLEQRLEDLDNGVDPLNRSATHTRVLHNVGHGIRRTGVNLKEMTGSVISAPFDIAQKVKKNMFGSVDNIPAIQDGSNVGHSTFYDGHEQHISSSKSDRGQIKEDEAKRLEEDEILLQPYDAQTRSRLDSTSQKAQIEELLRDDETMSADSLLQLLRSLRHQNLTLQKSMENSKRETDNEIRNHTAELANNRFKIQHLEQTLNETMELHQNEVKQLKNDLNLIGARMDYQYNDRFKKIEEAVESAQNRMYRMETNWHENSEKLLGAGQNMWNVLMLSGANIVVEILKITLYIIAVVLDSVKPLTGTRKRAGVAVISVFALFLLWNILGVSRIFSHSDQVAAVASSVPNNKLPE